jgi:hypothetical protein
VTAPWLEGVPEATSLENQVSQMLNLCNADRDAVTARWLEKSIETYPSQSLTFLLQERDRFRNPVGYTLREQLPIIAGELLGDMDRERLSNALEAIVRIRAVQDFLPGQAMAFLFQLKDVLREQWRGLDEQRIAVERRIDETALVAFDLYMKCREKIYEIKADEAKRRVACLERIYAGAEAR